MGLFSPAEMVDFRRMSDDAGDQPCAILRPDYAGVAAPTAIATTTCRVTGYPTGGGDVLDLGGDASHLIHLPHGTDARPGDEILVNGTHRYLALPTNDGRSYPYDLQIAARREA